MSMYDIFSCYSLFLCAQAGIVYVRSGCGGGRTTRTRKTETVFVAFEITFIIFVWFCFLIADWWCITRMVCELVGNSDFFCLFFRPVSLSLRPMLGLRCIYNVSSSTPQWEPHTVHNGKGHKRNMAILPWCDVVIQWFYQPCLAGRVNAARRRLFLWLFDISWTTGRYTAGWLYCSNDWEHINGYFQSTKHEKQYYNIFTAPLPSTARTGQSSKQASKQTRVGDVQHDRRKENWNLRMFSTTLPLLCLFISHHCLTILCVRSWYQSHTNWSWNARRCRARKTCSSIAGQRQESLRNCRPCKSPRHPLHSYLDSTGYPGI